jgi:F-type H+-transporting ATPase subunit epsilon
MDNLPQLLQVEIADIDRAIFSGLCRKLVAPAALGEICILPGHVALLTALRPGEIRLQLASGEDQFFYLSGGYLEVKDNLLTILADQILRSGEINEDAALAARNSAIEQLRSRPLFSDKDQARLELMKALAQLQVLEHTENYRLKRRQY